MVLELAHTRLRVYSLAREIVKKVYPITRFFPSEERYGLTSQARRAAVSIVLTVVEGCSRQSKAERKRYFEIARGSLIELDTALDIAVDLDYIAKEQLVSLNQVLIEEFKILSKLISASNA